MLQNIANEAKNKMTQKIKMIKASYKSPSRNKLNDTQASTNANDDSYLHHSPND